MSWILNVVVIMLCVGAAIWERKRSKGAVGWINTANYQYLITALLLVAYGVWAYLLGDASSFFNGVHLGNTMTALALGIITLAKISVELKMEMDRLGTEEVEDYDPMESADVTFEDMDSEEMARVSQMIVTEDQQEIIYNEVSYELEEGVDE